MTKPAQRRRERVLERLERRVAELAKLKYTPSLQTQTEIATLKYRLGRG